MLVVDDPIYNISSKFNEIELFYTQGSLTDSIYKFSI